MAVGGGDSMVAYRVPSNHAGIYSGLTGTGAASTISDAAICIGGSSPDPDENEILVQTDLTYADTGILTIKWAQTKSSVDVDKFLDAVSPKKSTSGSTVTEALVSENGKKQIGGEIAGAIDVLIIAHGGKDDETDDVEVEVAIGNMSRSSGSRTWVNGKWVQPTMEFVSVAAIATLSIPAALFNNGIVTPAGVQSLEKDYYAKTLRLPAVS